MKLLIGRERNDENMCNFVVTSVFADGLLPLVGANDG